MDNDREDGPLVGNIGEPFNAGDQPQVDERAKELEHLATEQAADIQYLTKIPQGRRFLLRMIDRCCPLQVGFYEDHAVMARCAGERAIGIWLIEELRRVDPAIWPGLQMEVALMEAQERVRARQQVENDKRASES